MKNYWVSWYCPPNVMGKFELHSPWWVSGFRMSDDAETVCAAIQAVSEDQARLKIVMSHDADFVKWASEGIEWRFVNERPDDWTPYGDRFPSDDWMVWQPLPGLTT